MSTYLSPWTDAREALLRKLHAEDELSYSEIAAKLGGGLSRNACIGKVNRMGLPTRAKSRFGAATPARLRPKSKPRANPRQRVSRLTFTAKNKAAARVVQIPVCDTFVSNLSPDDIPMRQRKQLLDLNPDDCRWPYGDVGTADFFFCGGPKESEKPYCKAHCRIAYGAKTYNISDEDRDRRSRHMRKIGMARRAAEL